MLGWLVRVEEAIENLSVGICTLLLVYRLAILNNWDSCSVYEMLLLLSKDMVSVRIRGTTHAALICG